MLIADDHAGLRLLLRQLLSRSHDVLEARDGAEALTMLASYPVDVAVLDLDMPQYSGLEVCRRIRADSRLCSIGVVVLTGSAVYPTATPDGVDSVLRKPSGVRLVSSVIDRLLSSPRRSLGAPRE